MSSVYTDNYVKIRTISKSPLCGKCIGLQTLDLLAQAMAVYAPPQHPLKDPLLEVRESLISRSIHLLASQQRLPMWFPGLEPRSYCSFIGSPSCFFPRRRCLLGELSVGCGRVLLLVVMGDFCCDGPQGLEWGGSWFSCPKRIFEISKNFPVLHQDKKFILKFFVN